MMLRRKILRFFHALRNLVFVFAVFMVILIYFLIKNHEEKVLNEIPKSAMKYLEFQETNFRSPFAISTLKRVISKYNAEEYVSNLDVFGPVKKDTLVLVVSTEKLTLNFKYLLVSLSNLWGIEDVLIIFSHLDYDEDFNRLIRTIDFARVLQIFYPYSVALYPNIFPGYHPNDCRHDMGMSLAEAVNCSGAFSPDIHGHYRNPILAQSKHFWWWTLNKVFEDTAIIADHPGTFVLMEDHLFVMEDFIYMTKHMKKICDLLVHCDIVSLESPNEYYFSKSMPWEVEIKTWDPSEHARVLAFDKSVWDSISAQYHLFCSVDDYTWSRSLYYLSLNRKDGTRFRVMSSLLPRAFSTANLSAFGKVTNYNIIEVVYQLMDMFSRKRNLFLDSFFPRFLKVFVEIELDHDGNIIFDYIDNKGGWSDPRDIKMCHNLSLNKIKKSILDMKAEYKDLIEDD